VTRPAIEHDESYSETPWQVVGPDGSVLAAYPDRAVADTTAERMPGTRVQHYRWITLAKLRAQDAAWRADCRRLGFPPDLSIGRLLDQVEGLDLTPAEWSTVAWFVGWDANDNMAAILGKARAAGPAVQTDASGAAQR